MLVGLYHRIVYIPFIMILIFESQCVELIHLRTISLIDVISTWNSLPRSHIKSKSVAWLKHNLRYIDLSSLLNQVF